MIGVPPRLRLAVGLRAPGMNGIETYADEVAAVAAAGGHEVTLFATDEEAAAQSASRVPSEVRIVVLGIPGASPAAALAGRLWDELAMLRVSRQVRRRLGAVAGTTRAFDVAHLNRSALAREFRSLAPVVVTAAWFYPHAPLARLRAAWEHNGGALPRRSVLAVKSLSYYRGDRRGFAHSDRIVAPTASLAEQLRSQGFAAFECPPPISVPEAVPSCATAGNTRGLHVISVSGDLSHPRKNIGVAVRACRALADAGRTVTLELIGRNADRVVPRAVPDGLRIVAPGPLPRGEVHRRMSAADVLALPSRFEEWGYVAVESLMLGTPVATLPVYPFASMLAPVGDDGLSPFGVVAAGESATAFAAALVAAGAATGTPMRGAALAQAAAARFGPEAAGATLTRIWNAAPVGSAA